MKPILAQPRGRPTGLPADLVCYCRSVPYSSVETAIADGKARCLADIQRETTACTRCFGCRFELQRILTERLGAEYDASEIVTVPVEDPAQLGRVRRVVRRFRREPHPPSTLPRRMYMPVLSGYGGYEVETRLTMFNWGDDLEEAKPVRLRLDLLALDGTRLAARELVVAPRGSAVIEAADLLDGQDLPDGVGFFKAIVEARALGSLRPYFHIVSPTGITSTHEKANSASPRIRSDYDYYWLFPIAPRLRPEEAYFVFANTQAVPTDRHVLIWQDETGSERSVPLPEIGLDQGACVPLHEHFPELLEASVAGAVRLSPPTHKVAGWMLTHDPREDLWRVQHL